MTIDVELVEALARAAAAHHPDPPDLAAIREGGRRRARRRTATRVGSGVAAVAVVLLGASPLLPDGDTSSAPRPTAPPLGELSIGEPPAVPYCAGDKTIVVGDREVRARCDVLVTRSGSTLYLGDRRGVVQLREDDVPVLLDDTGPAWWFPAVSSDGRWAAWLTRAGGDPRLVVADLDTSEVVAEVPWASAHGWVPGIDDLGRVYTVDFDSADVHAYDIDKGVPFEVTGTPDHASPGIRFVTADGFGILPGNPVGPVVVGTVSDVGEFRESREVPWDMVNWSPDRSRVVRESADGLVVSPADGNGAEVPLLVPERGSVTWLPVWEDEEHVLVQFDPFSDAPESIVDETTGLDVPAKRTWLLRCAADTGDCEVALAPGWGDGLTYPPYR